MSDALPPGCLGECCGDIGSPIAAARSISIEHPTQMLIQIAERIRRQTMEHVFGTLKAWMGAAHFLMKMLPKVKTDMSLHVLAYNLKRVMQIFGVKPVMEATTG